MEAQVRKVDVAPSDQENPTLALSTRNVKSRIPVFKSRLPLRSVPQTRKRAMKKQDKDKQDPPNKAPTDTPNEAPGVQSSPDKKKCLSHVKSVPNFKKLHKKWGEKLDKAKATSRRKDIPYASPFATDNASLLPPLSLTTRRTNHVSSTTKHTDLAGAIFERMALTTSRAIRIMSRTDQENVEPSSVKLNLEEQFTNVQDPSLITYTPSTIHSLPCSESSDGFYDVDEEVCAIFSGQQTLPINPPPHCSGRRNPLPGLLDKYYFLPLKI